MVIPINRDNIDTDAIIPKQFLKSVEKSGFGDNLFDAWRYEDQGEPGADCSGRPLNKDFVLNRKPYPDGSFFLRGKILVAGPLANMRCGHCATLVFGR